MLKKLILVLFLSLSFYSYGQKNVLSLHKIDTKRTTLLEENRRIRVKTIHGKVYKGKFHLVNDNAIVIKKDTIKVSDIYKIRPQSFVSGTFSTLFKAYGSTIVLYGVAYIISGGYGAILGLIFVPFGSVFGSIGYIIDGSNHSSPRWEYKIIRNESNEKTEPLNIK